jgi:hypothetical protein
LTGFRAKVVVTRQRVSVIVSLHETFSCTIHRGSDTGAFFAIEAFVGIVSYCAFGAGIVAFQACIGGHVIRVAILAGGARRRSGFVHFAGHTGVKEDALIADGHAGKAADVSEKQAPSDAEAVILPLGTLAGINGIESVGAVCAAGLDAGSVAAAADAGTWVTLVRPSH